MNWNRHEQLMAKEKYSSKAEEMMLEKTYDWKAVVKVDKEAEGLLSLTSYGMLHAHGWVRINGKRYLYYNYCNASVVVEVEEGSEYNIYHFYTIRDRYVPEWKFKPLELFNDYRIIEVVSMVG